MGAFGLQTHIWRNNFRSALLLAGFPVLLLVLLFGLNALFTGLANPELSLERSYQTALASTLRTWPFALGAAGVWFLIAWVFHQKIVEASVGARSITRKEAPQLYNLLENLCISRGLKTPRLRVIESPGLNAFASGIDERTFTITLTRGLIETLNERELRSVLAHELTHIVNRDVRLLIVAVIFVGVFSFFGELVFRGFFRSGVRVGGHTRSRNGDSRGGGLLILAGLAAIALAYLLAVAIRFSLSLKREYLADAGAVDLTRDPDAMISALARISGKTEVDAPSDIRQMMLGNDARFAGLFATHPPIEKRIEALKKFAGGV